MTTVELLGLPREDLAGLLERLGVSRGHAQRAFMGIHRHGLAPDAIPGLGRHGRVLAAHGRRAAVGLGRVVASADGTRKLRFDLEDGAQIEAVLIPMRDDRLTLCVSTQAGCAMACRFCATGTLGLKRHLSAGEIVAQVYAAQALVAGEERALRNIVLMGMGEPLHNYDAVRDALRVLTDHAGISFALRHITLSTVGIVPKIRQLAEDFGGRIQLALSLHAGTDATRRQIIPLAQKYDLAMLRQACLDYPLPGSRALMLEYAVLPGVNDTDAELDGVAAWQQGMRAVVNLIPFNPFPGAPYRSPTREEIVSASDRLKARGALTTVRMPRGRDAAGACGQLFLAS